MHWPGACLGRPLWRHELLSQPPHPRNRHSHGPGRAARHGRAARSASGLGAHTHCHSAGLACRMDVIQAGFELSLWDSTARRIDLCACAALSDCHRSRGLLDSRPPCRIHRPHASPADGIVSALNAPTLHPYIRALHPHFPPSIAQCAQLRPPRCNLLLKANAGMGESPAGHKERMHGCNQN